MRLDSCSEFLFTDGSIEKNVNIFGADMSSTMHIDNKNKNILILGERPTQGFVVCTSPPPPLPPFCWGGGLNLQPNFQKRGALQDLNF